MSTFVTTCRDDAPSVCAVSTYRSWTSITARAASKKTNGAVAMKMNIVFWDSSMPNQRIVSGMSTATGMLRAKIDSGPVNASTTR